MRYLMVLLLCCTFPVCSFAQADSTATLPDARMMFRSKVRQLTSYLNEGNSGAANVLFNDVAKAMDEFIKSTQVAMDTAGAAEKRNLKEKLTRQRQLAAQFHSFNANLVRNREAIDVWTEQFVKTLY